MRQIHDIKWEQRKMPGAPMIDMGFLIKRSRPLMPEYLLRQPADHSRTTYSEPKNSTSTISCGAQGKQREQGLHLSIGTETIIAEHIRDEGCGGR